MKRIIVLLLAALLLLSGCNKESSNTKVVLTTGFVKDEVFRIETISCSVPEVMVYLTNIQQRYQHMFGDEIWDMSWDGVRLEDNIKETTLSQLAQIKTMNLLADKHGVILDEGEMERVREAAQAYYDSLNDTERQVMQVTEEVIENMYAEYARAEKVYEFIIRDINPEISDDEARTIIVQQILLKTYTLDGTGKKIDFSEEAKAGVYERAREILAMAQEEGSDFEQLIITYSEAEKGTYSFGKGEMDVVFETAAFNLGNGEISEIVETEYGYHIIKCISTFDREETDANKIKIVEERRDEVFGREYEEFVSSLTRNLNENLWESIMLTEEEGVSTSNFFEIYDQYMG